jgi:Co/Zn/Cd efflux system component
MKTETLAYLGAIATILVLIAAVVILLVFHIITLDQVGPFLIALIVPITAIAGLPIFKAALAAPSPDQLQQVQQQNQQLHGTLNQAVQSLAQVAQPAQAVQATSNVMPTPEAEQPIIPQMTAPLAAMQKPGQ